MVFFFMGVSFLLQIFIVVALYEIACSNIQLLERKL